ncbi:hypothetical protein [Streptomyces sp. NPDC008139]|uniref:hypothetical protein n=1 Tax=Streptomyces sp. NPDC008139 TaxID=3364814 RepID=UPI0036EEE3A1
MNITGTDFYRAFADRVRTTVTTAPEGSPTMNTTAETVEAPAAPATFAGPAAELAELLAAHDAQMVEGDFDANVHGWAAHVNGRITLVFPQGQDRAMRLDVARKMIARLTAVRTGPCGNAWCQETEQHTHCYGDSIEMPSGVLHGHLMHDRRTGVTTVNYGPTDNDDITFGTGDEVRAETARVRAHLARLDLLADQLDAINEAGGTAPRPVDDAHFPWCAPGECIEHATSPTEHQGPRNVLPDTRDRHAEPIGYSRLSHVPNMDDDTQISVTFRGEGTTYDAPQLTR